MEIEEDNRSQLNKSDDIEFENHRKKNGINRSTFNTTMKGSKAVSAYQSVSNTEIQQDLRKSQRSNQSALNASILSTNVVLDMQTRGIDTEKVFKIVEVCMNAIDQNNHYLLRSIVDNELPQGTLIFDLVNREGQNLLHLCALKDQQKAFNTVILAAKDNYQSRKEFSRQMKDWINQKTWKDKFTPLLYASFRGNVEMCKLLLDLGADISSTNKFGLNVLHVAAQGDQPLTLYFFHKIKQLDICSTDSRGSTPLHWACFSCSELALIFLLAWLTPKQLTMQDIDGYTALHLSVKSTEKLKNCRMTRALLYRGAAKELTDKKGNKALDLAKNISSVTVRADLEKILSRQSSMCDCLMLKTPLKKMGKSLRMPMVFLLLFLAATFALASLLYPIFQNIQLVYASAAAQALTLFFWLVSAFKNPGFIQKPKQVDFLNLMQLIDPVQLCPDCEIVRTPRSRHCGTCNHCVERFDHHCPWINNCVGIANHSFFIGFLFFLAISIIVNFCLTIDSIIKIDGLQISSISLNYMLFSSEFHRNKEYITYAQYLVLAITGIFVVPIILLSSVQLKNFCLNRTTNERFGNKKYNGKKGNSKTDTQESESDYSATTSLLAEDLIKELGEPEDFSNKQLSCLYNIKAMCCNSQTPDQRQIYEALTQNRQNRHMSSIANFNEFTNQLSDMKNRRASEYMLFVDPYDNQGMTKKFSMSKRQLNSPVGGRKKAFSITETSTGNFDINFSRTNQDSTHVELTETEQIVCENSLDMKQEYLATGDFKQDNYLSKVSERTHETSKQPSEKESK